MILYLPIYGLVSELSIYTELYHRQSNKITSLAGLEPAVFPLGEGRVIHYATEIADTDTQNYYSH